MNTLGMRQCDIGKDPEILSVIQKWMVNISKILEYRKQPIFPVGEKLIAPGMQRIEYAVIHKTRRSKRELHN
jgi:hypothetical protein